MPAQTMNKPELSSTTPVKAKNVANFSIVLSSTRDQLVTTVLHGKLGAQLLSNQICTNSPTVLLL